MNDLLRIQRKCASDRALFVQRKCGCGGSCSSCGETELRRSVKEIEEPPVRNSVPLQKKLSLSRPGDACEREADAVAGAFLGDTPIAVNATPPHHTTQRQEEAEKAEEIADEQAADTEMAEELDEDDGIIGDESGFPKRNAAAAVIEDSTLSIQRSGGEPLEQSARQTAEQRFVTDFSAVRVHHDAGAASAAESLNAEAFTIGSHIYFGAGRYQPGARKGLELLAHELTHVVQQRRGTAISPQMRGSSCGGGCVASSAKRHDGCNRGSPAADETRFIEHLQVRRGAHSVKATWSDETESSWPCSPSTRSGRGGKIPTPIGDDVIGIKCDSQHTNRHGDGMGWFTAFRSHGRAIGFHNSQLVGPSRESHGCVRVCCDVAHIIHDNTSSGITTIKVVA